MPMHLREGGGVVEVYSDDEDKNEDKAKGKGYDEDGKKLELDEDGWDVMNAFAVNVSSPSLFSFDSPSTYILTSIPYLTF